jgi:uncharacterized membrane protein
MNKRPLSVTLISYLLVAVGIIELGFLFSQFNFHRPVHYDDVLVGVVRLAAIVCGVFMLRGSNWARWLAIAWLVFHVGVSAFGSVREMIAHSLFLVVIAYFLLRPDANRFFRLKGKQAT